MNLPCGRLEKCRGCSSLHATEARDVCVAVGSLLTEDAIEHTRELRYYEIEESVHGILTGIVDDDDWVTPRMSDAGARSVRELLKDSRFKGN